MTPAADDDLVAAYAEFLRSERDLDDADDTFESLLQEIAGEDWHPSTDAAPVAEGVQLRQSSPDSPQAVLHLPRRERRSWFGDLTVAAALRSVGNDANGMPNIDSGRVIDAIEAAQERAITDAAAAALLQLAMIPETIDTPCPATMVTDDPAAADNTGNRRAPPTLLALTRVTLTAAPPRRRARTTHPA